MSAACHHPEALLAQAHDGEVGPESPPRGQPGRVHDPADGDVDLTERQALEEVERARSGYVEDGEGRQVEEAGPVAHGQVLGVDDG